MRLPINGGIDIITITDWILFLICLAVFIFILVLIYLGVVKYIAVPILESLQDRPTRDFNKKKKSTAALIESLTSDLKTKTLTKEERILRYLELSKNYNTGVDDAIVGDKLIPGIKPDNGKAIKYQMMAIKLGYRRGYLNLAKIYLYSNPPQIEAGRLCVTRAREVLTADADIADAMQLLEYIRTLTHVEEEEAGHRDTLGETMTEREQPKDPHVLQIKGAFHEPFTPALYDQRQTGDMTQRMEPTRGMPGGDQGGTRGDGHGGTRGTRGGGQEGLGGIRGTRIGGQEGLGGTRGGDFIPLLGGTQGGGVINPLTAPAGALAGLRQWQDTAAANIALVQEFIQREQMIHNPEVHVRERMFQNHSQNVHDHAVVSTERESINRLRSAQGRSRTPITTNIQLLRRFIEANHQNPRGGNAIRVLDYMCTHGNERTSLDASEMEVLNLVMNSIDCDTDKMNALVLEMASGVEHGEVVCTQGRISRVLNALNGLDDNVRIVHTDMIKQEMLQKAPKIREELLKGYSQADQETIDSLDVDTTGQRLQEAFKQRFKAVLIGKYKTDYVDSGLITEAHMLREINGWIDYIE